VTLFVHYACACGILLINFGILTLFWLVDVFFHFMQSYLMYAHTPVKRVCVYLMVVMAKKALPRFLLNFFK